MSPRAELRSHPAQPHSGKTCGEEWGGVGWGGNHVIFGDKFSKLFFPGVPVVRVRSDVVLDPSIKF